MRSKTAQAGLDIWGPGTHRVDRLMQTIPLLCLPADREAWNMLGQCGLPLGQLPIAAVEAPVHGKTATPLTDTLVTWVCDRGWVP